MKEAKLAGLIAVVLVAENKSVRLVPVDTSRLRSSITHKIDENDLYGLIGTNVSYATFVEFGTFRQVAQPFIRPAIEGHEREYREIAQRHINEVINRA